MPFLEGKVVKLWWVVATEETEKKKASKKLSDLGLGD
jgi:hypothetical protein